MRSRGDGGQFYSIRATNNDDEAGGRKLIVRNEGSTPPFDVLTLDDAGSLILSVGDVILSGADCAEDFEIDGSCLTEAEPGTVMVLNDDGRLRPSVLAYDKRVAGVVSGAGNHRTGIILDRQLDRSQRRPLALVGKVFCKVDATNEPVSIGDLLTTSATHGHAMKATDPMQAFGAVLGKALRPLKEGCGLIPVLVALQ